mmetsp:Transcript_47546/g.155749  ORF Transcript_47546/g.155749 Transcript_47546/m.155749 type:complete len:104 (+) Transcript_47546:73-384(+)
MHPVQDARGASRPRGRPREAWLRDGRDWHAVSAYSSDDRERLHFVFKEFPDPKFDKLAPMCEDSNDWLDFAADNPALRGGRRRKREHEGGAAARRRPPLFAPR